MRDLNSRVTEEHSRARVRDRHQLVDCDRLLGASWSAGSPRDWNTSSAYWQPVSKLNRSKMLKTKMSFNFESKYMGINYDEKIEQKIIMSEKNIIKTSYFPELSINKDKKYKIIATSS